jgi:hypothetical protein
MMDIEDFLGTTATVMLDKSDRSGSSHFFKPYSGAINVLGRTASIVTDSLGLGGVTAFLALAAGWELLKAIGNLVTGNVSDAVGDAAAAGFILLLACEYLIAGIISPVVNTVDLIGGAVNTVRGCCASSEEEEVGSSFALN